SWAALDQTLGHRAGRPPLPSAPMTLHGVLLAGGDILARKGGSGGKRGGGVGGVHTSGGGVLPTWAWVLIILAVAALIVWVVIRKVNGDCPAEQPRAVARHPGPLRLRSGLPALPLRPSPRAIRTSAPRPAPPPCRDPQAAPPPRSGAPTGPRPSTVR